MTRIAAVADVHIGNHKRFGGPSSAGINRRCRAALDVLEEALDLAVREQCCAFFVAGDLYDYARPEAQVIAAVQGLFDAARAKSGDKMQIVAVLGNHECVSSQPGDHALGPMAPVSEVVDVPKLYGLGGAQVACVPYQPGPAMQWLPEAVSRVFGGKKKPDGPRILVIHLGVADEKTAPWLSGALDAVHVSALEDLCKAWKISTVLAGNWHDRRSWSLCSGRAFVQQIGALVPTGFDNPGLKGYGGVAVVELGGKPAVKVHDLEGPRFIKCGPDDGKILKAAQEYEGDVYVEVTAPAEQLGGAAADLKGMVEAGTLAGAVALPDAVEVAVAARTAAAAARSREGLFEALAAYVQEMPLPEGVDRGAVLQRSRQYLAKEEG